MSDAPSPPAGTARAPLRVALVNMPFTSSRFPSIPLGLLQAILRQRGIACDVHYLNLAFGAVIGWELLDRLCEVRGRFVGEWIFSRAAFGETVPPSEAYLDAFPDDVAGVAKHLGREAAALHDLRDHAAPAFIGRCLDAVPWQDYDVVGFGSMFQQICAALALARRLRERFPHLRTVFGGPNFEGEMGLELVRTMPYIDYAVIGEGDEVFPALLERLAAGEEPLAMPGVAMRDGAGGVAFAGPAPQARSLDALPDPDYTDYIMALSRFGVPDRVDDVDIHLLYESARGCWWGVKHHCTFCGLANLELGYRSKSPQRVLDGFAAMADRYGLTRFIAVDNIMDHRYPREVFAKLAEGHVDYEFASEVKANLTPEQLGTLARAGVREIQPGIESLSTPILRLMRKGTTGIQNVRLLKWAAYHGMLVRWNILLGFPGERAEDYAHQLALLRRIPHLQPPGGCGPIRMERFSPYFETPEAWGIRILEPDAAYAYIYPVHVDLDRLAYEFEHEAPDTLPPEAHAELIDYVKQWKEQAAGSSRSYLLYIRGPTRIRVLDGRTPGARRDYTLNEPAALAYEFCGPAAHGLGQILEHLRGQGMQPDTARVLRDLADLVDLGLMMEEDGHYLSLALPVNRNW